MGEQGDKQVASNVTTTGDRLTYTLAYEMIAPLRNAMMYVPESVTSNLTQWLNLTKVLKDCDIKTHDENRTIGNKTMPFYSVDHMYEVLKDARKWVAYPLMDHMPIEAFLDESQLALLCKATHIESTFCSEPREFSDCW